MPLFHKPKLSAMTPPSPEGLVRKFTSKKESGVLAALSLSSAVALSVPAPNVPANDEGSSPQTVPMIADGSIPEYTDNQKEAWMVAHREMPQARGAEYFLNKIEGIQDSLTLSPGRQAVGDTLAVPARALMDMTPIAETIQEGVNTFMDAVPVLMKALDEVAKIHPFISVAVLAFKAVYTLETKRRENDKRVLVLYVEMKDMMGVLVQLKDVSDPKQIAPDGQTIEDRTKKLCEDVAEDIKNCANACDTYLKKKLLVKIFAGPIWDERLVAFVQVFAKKRKELEFTLTIHTTIGVDAINERTAEITRKMDTMLRLFQEFVTPEQKKLAAMVEERGGIGVLKNKEAVKELAEAEFAFPAPSGSDGQRDGDRTLDLAELQSEIDGGPDKAIEKNAQVFNRKFDIQTRQIKEDIARAVKREGDRIISAVTAGPHDRIVDPDIYNIWSDMRWRGSVEGRLFVMSLKDYYVEKVAAESGSLKGPDGWAIKYINTGRARSILEAFDDDASGFVTVNEVNKLTQSRPREWSLPHWIAYWAIGWQMACTAYREKIEEIFDAMIRLAYEVLPENRKGVNVYIATVWQNVTILVQSIKRENGTAELRSKFESHVAAEEAKLQKNFEDIKYDIDSHDTVQLIAGEGRLETTIFPMLYLALKRDLEKISLARKYVLSVDELNDALETIHYITDAAWYRITDLRCIFEQQNLNAKSQFEVFANGLYNISHVQGAALHGDKLRELPDPTPCRDEIIPDPDSIPLSILNYPLGKKQEIDFTAYDPPELTLSRTEGADSVLGIYYGFIYEFERPISPMIKFTLRKGEDENTFIAVGVHYRYTAMYDYEITGGWGFPLDDGRFPAKTGKHGSPWDDGRLPVEIGEWDFPWDDRRLPAKTGKYGFPSDDGRLPTKIGKNGFPSDDWRLPTKIGKYGLPSDDGKLPTKIGKNGFPSDDWGLPTKTGKHRFPPDDGRLPTKIRKNGFPSDDGKLPVKFRFSCVALWVNIELTGVFDSEENSLRGITLSSANGVKGEFVFKRNPDFVRFYPAPSVMNARKRWEFATASVFYDIHRNTWSPARIHKRIEDRKRYMDLALRHSYGRKLTEDEETKFYALPLVLHEADVRFYTSLISIHLSRTPIFWINCANCNSPIGGSRITCMDCRGGSTTVDLCSEPECVSSTITFEAANRKAHTPNHGMFKVHRIIFDRDMGRIERTAKDVLKSVRETTSELKEGKEPMLACVRCKTTISLPCWFCGDCADGAGGKFICDNCEHKGLAFNEAHTKMHTLVRVSEEVEEKELSVEERLRLVEDQLVKIGQYLAKLVEKSGEGSPGDPLTKGDLQAAATQAEYIQLGEEAAGATENA